MVGAEEGRAQRGVGCYQQAEMYRDRMHTPGRELGSELVMDVQKAK